jgi:hypothetical protein
MYLLYIYILVHLGIHFVKYKLRKKRLIFLENFVEDLIFKSHASLQMRWIIYSIILY